MSWVFGSFMNHCSSCQINELGNVNVNIAKAKLTRFADKNEIWGRAETNNMNLGGGDIINFTKI